MSIRSIFGIDGFDLLVHVGVTIGVATLAGTFWSIGDAQGIAVTVTLTASLVLLGLRRRWGLRRGVPAGDRDGARVAELEQRVADLELTHQRIQELEERLDFAERLLSRHDELRVPRVGEGSPQ